MCKTSTGPVVIPIPHGASFCRSGVGLGTCISDILRWCRCCWSRDYTWKISGLGSWDLLKLWKPKSKLSWPCLTEMAISRMKDVLERERPRGSQASDIFSVLHRWGNQNMSRDLLRVGRPGNSLSMSMLELMWPSKSNGDIDPHLNNSGIFLGQPDLGNPVQGRSVKFEFQILKKNYFLV